MISILPLLQTSIVYYAIILTIAWIFIQIISRISFRRFIPTVSNKLVFIALFIYILLTLLLVNVNVNLFPYLHAAMLAFILLIILSSPKANLRLLLIATFVIALMPVLVMVSINPLPLGDDARFPGFAIAIRNDGHWIPFKYEENPYYQFFHLIPYVEYVLAIITGSGLENISIYYLILKIGLYISYLIFIYLLIRVVVKNEKVSIIAVLLLSITPPLALTQVISQNYAIVLSILSVFLILKICKSAIRPLKSHIISIWILWIVGIIAHATYTLILIAFMLPLMFMERSQELKRTLIKLVGLLMIVSFAYWTSVSVLDILIDPTVNAADMLIKLLTGQISPSFSGGLQSWYNLQSSNYFVAWAFIPSIVGSYSSLTILYKFLKKRISDDRLAGAMGVLGLVTIIINYMLRSEYTFGGRYFYWLFLLMLPLSAVIIAKTSKNFMSLILSIFLISLISFYGVQDPTMSANTYGNIIGWADKTTWNISSLLVQNLPQSSYLLVSGDQRITATLFTNYQIFNKTVQLPSDGKPSLIIAGSDNVWRLNLNVLKLFIPNILNMTNPNSPGNLIIFSTESFTVYYSVQ
jgi:hypothetical protein